MDDSVTSNVLFSGTRHYIVRFTNESDGTGESAVIKVDRSSLTGLNGSTPSHLVVEEIEWSVSGFNYVTVFWEDDDGDEVVDVLTGDGYKDYSRVGGLQKPTAPDAATDGDIKFTTDGGADGSAYDITLVIKLKD